MLQMAHEEGEKEGRSGKKQFIIEANALLLWHFEY